MVTSADLEFSTFQRRPAYRYIRAADRLPTIPETRSRYHSEIVLLEGEFCDALVEELAYARFDRREVALCDMGRTVACRSHTRVQFRAWRFSNVGPDLQPQP